MNDRSGKRSISGLAALILLGVFAAGILTVLLTGARAYKGLTGRDAISHDSRTCVQYLTTKVRQAPAPDAVVLSNFGEGDSLLLRENIDGSEYWTRVYCHDGWMMELFTLANAGLAPEDGEKILPMEALSLSLDGVLLTAALRNPDGTEVTLTLTSRLCKEVLP